ncbi:MAG: amidohydrolase [Chloroflexota bacterium]|nr:amidohydrolase [Chloroflexota bacterium]
MLDLRIDNAAVMTMDGQRRELRRGSIAVNEGKIVSVEETEFFPKNPVPQAKRVIDAQGMVALPGLINCHTHVYQALIEGIGYDMHFDPWNWRFNFPIASQIGPEHAEVGAQIAALEMIKSGTTTVSDHWYLHNDFESIHRVAEAFRDAGLRHHVVYGLLDQSFAGEHVAFEDMAMIRREDELIEAANVFIDRWHQKGRTVVALGPGSTEDISDRLMDKTIKMARSRGLQLATHVAGWAEIVSRSLKHYAMRDLEHVHEIGLTGPDSILIHAVWLSPREIRLVAETGCKVAHCPVANAHLGYGVAPVPELRAAGVMVGLGTDGAASYTYDLFEVMKMAAMLQKVKQLDAEVLTAEDVLEMATVDGARVLGLEEHVGSLEPGKRADIVLVDFYQPHLMLNHQVASKLVYSARGHDVVTTIVDGQVIMENRQVLTLDEDALLDRARETTADLVSRAGIETRDLLDAGWPEQGPRWRRAVTPEWLNAHLLSSPATH